MKLRIKGDTLRLRLSRTEVARLASDGAVAETTHFPGNGVLQYAVRQDAGAKAISARAGNGSIEILLPNNMAAAWATGEEVGLYADVPAGAATLAIAVEKDFACLDREDADNADAYPNPKGRC